MTNTRDGDMKRNWHWCKNCREEKRNYCQEFIRKGVNVICAGCNSEEYQLAKYGKPLTIQRPSRAIREDMPLDPPVELGEEHYCGEDCINHPILPHYPVYD